MWLFFLPKASLFTLQTLSCLSLHSLTTTLSLLSVGDSICGKANTSVMSVLFWEAPDDKCLDGVDEPQRATSQPQHPPCVPSCFSLIVLSIHTHHTKWCSCDSLSNGVLSHSTNVMCHPPHSNTITPSLLPPITTDTYHMGSVITANAKHPNTTTVKAIHMWLCHCGDIHHGASCIVVSTIPQELCDVPLQQTQCT